MDGNEYELFERLPDHTLTWRGLVRGLEGARVSVLLLADEIGRECYAADSNTRTTVLVRTPLHQGRRVFLVGYDNGLVGNAHLLHSYGYDVTSAYGNRIAQFVLCMHPRYELFVIDNSGPEKACLEMVSWLDTAYPNTPSIALHPELAEASHPLARTRLTRATAVVTSPKGTIRAFSRA